MYLYIYDCVGYQLFLISKRRRHKNQTIEWNFFLSTCWYLNSSWLLSINGVVYNLKPFKYWPKFIFVVNIQNLFPTLYFYALHVCALQAPQIGFELAQFEWHPQQITSKSNPQQITSKLDSLCRYLFQHLSDRLKIDIPQFECNLLY